MYVRSSHIKQQNWKSNCELCLHYIQALVKSLDVQLSIHDTIIGGLGNLSPIYVKALPNHDTENYY